jgi:hypothetical protein
MRLIEANKLNIFCHFVRFLTVFLSFSPLTSVSLDAGISMFNLFP